ncbi:MAG TPA: hypothetical protein VHS27_13230 [Gaiellales bacterium]|jgi:hypothetical protein|nr:hypothetical protein [Gaiellales bacterium]
MVDADTYSCAFPGCAQTAETTVMRDGAEEVPLCAAHLNLMVNNPDEVDRIWGPTQRPQPEFQASGDDPA